MSVFIARILLLDIIFLNFRKKISKPNYFDFKDLYKMQIKDIYFFMGLNQQNCSSFLIFMQVKFKNDSFAKIRIAYFFSLTTQKFHKNFVFIINVFKIIFIIVCLLIL